MENDSMKKEISEEQNFDEDYSENEITFSDMGLSDGQLDTLYAKGRFRLIQERVDFLLPQIEDFVKTKAWMNISPEYQRRRRWSIKKKSELIESFLMNIPVPPIFLYEGEISRYEVMDGQQRLNSILQFYNNEFNLKGLKTWPALNGKNYANLPPQIRRGLDRAKISANILLSVEKGGANKESDIRTLVFDRLNTGGEKLNPQELRNCLFSGPFNDLLIKLSGARVFTDIWGIPPHEENKDEDGNANAKLNGNSLYKTMADCQIVLRFFAFKNEEKIVGSVRKILDTCMELNRKIPEVEINILGAEFTQSLNLALEIFGEDVFRLPEKESGQRPLSRPLFDAIMITLHRLFGRKLELLEKREKITFRLSQILKDKDIYEILVGKGNTADSIKKRFNTLVKEFEEVLTEG